MSATVYEGPNDAPSPPDLAAIEAFLTWWFRACNEGHVEIAYNTVEDRSIKRAKRFQLGKFNDAAKFATQINSVPGVNVYFAASTVNTNTDRRSSDLNFVQSPGVWIDQDSEENITRNVESMFRPAVTVLTGTHPHVRRHLWFQSSEPLIDMEMVRNLNRRLQNVYGGDTSVVNPTSLMRLPGSIAWPRKKGRDVVEATTWNFNQGWVAYPPVLFNTQLPKLPDPPPLNPVETAPRTTDAILDDIHSGREKVDPQKAIEGLVDGSWNTNMIRLVARWVALGLTDFEIQALAPSATLPQYTQERTEVEIQHAIDSARKKFKVTRDPYEPVEDAAIRGAIAFENAPDITPEVPPLVNGGGPVPIQIFNQTEARNRYGKKPEFIVDGIIPVGSSVIMAGLPGVGKSPIVQKLAAHIALGVDIPECVDNGTGEVIPAIPVKAGRVVYCSGESPGQTTRNVEWFANKLLAAQNGELPTNDTLERAILELDRTFCHVTTSFSLEQDVMQVIATIENYANARWDNSCPDIIIFDTLRSLSYGSTNKEEDVALMTAGMRRVRQRWPSATTIAIHHAAKGDPEGFSGSNRLTGDGEILLSVTAHARGNNEPKKQLEFWGPDTGGRMYSLVKMTMIRNKLWQNIKPIWSVFTVKNDVLDIDRVEGVQATSAVNAPSAIVTPIVVPGVVSTLSRTQLDDNVNGLIISVVVDLGETQATVNNVTQKIVDLYNTNRSALAEEGWLKLYANKPFESCKSAIRRRLESLCATNVLVSYKYKSVTHWKPV